MTETVVEATASEIFPQSKDEGWGDTPINIKIAPRCGYQSIGNCGLTVVNNVGCDVAIITVLARAIPAGVRGRYLDDWGGWKHGPHKQYNSFVDSLYERYQDKMFGALVNFIPRMGDYHCYLFSDGVNKHHKNRGNFYSHLKPTTAWFCRKLVEKKIGYIVQSPLCLNMAHKSPTDFGWIRTWTWFPEGAMIYKPDKYLGYGKHITKDELLEKVSNLGNFKAQKLSKEVLERDYLNSYKIP